MTAELSVNTCFWVACMSNICRTRKANDVSMWPHNVQELVTCLLALMLTLVLAYFFLPQPLPIDHKKPDAAVCLIHSKPLVLLAQNPQSHYGCKELLTPLTQQEQNFTAQFEIPLTQQQRWQEPKFILGHLSYIQDSKTPSCIPPKWSISDNLQ